MPISLSVYVSLLPLVMISSYWLYFRRYSQLKSVVRLKDTVFITGCDSGLGYTFAKYLCSQGCVVFAGILNPTSEGVTQLKNPTSVQLQKHSNEGEINLVEVDVTDPISVENCFKFVNEEIKKRNLNLVGVVNNAGVMVFGEFEWQTWEQLIHQIQVNLVGSMRIAQTFLPLLRHHKGRLVNVSSHCCRVPLPCLSVYSASKAALQAWSAALALEMDKFSVPVITLLPGSYVHQSGILRNQSRYQEEMWRGMCSEAREVYTSYFSPLMEYIGAIKSPGPAPQYIHDPALLSRLDQALFSSRPSSVYVNSPTRYTLYHGLILLAAFCPPLQRKLILRYCSYPNYR